MKAVEERQRQEEAARYARSPEGKRAATRWNILAYSILAAICLLVLGAIVFATPPRVSTQLRLGHHAFHSGFSAQGAGSPMNNGPGTVEG